MGRGRSKIGNNQDDLPESNEKPLGEEDQKGFRAITIIPQEFRPDDLKTSIGKKGSPIGIKDAIAGANPFRPYQVANMTRGDFERNCQRCVVAYELRRRGYDVVASPTFAGDKLPVGNRWAGAFRHGEMLNVGSSNPRTAQANLERQMRSFGPGSRGIVGIPGHVFNVENVGGKIRYVDAQTNTVYNSNGVFSRLGKKAAAVRLMRTDNLRLSDRAKKSVVQNTDRIKSMVSESASRTNIIRGGVLEGWHTTRKQRKLR